MHGQPHIRFRIFVILTVAQLLKTSSDTSGFQSLHMGSNQYPRSDPLNIRCMLDPTWDAFLLPNFVLNFYMCRSQWLRVLRRGSAAALLLWLSSNPAGVLDVCLLWVLCVIRYRSLCRLITRPGESYRVWHAQWKWSRSPIRGGHDPGLGQSATGGGGKGDLLHILLS